MKLLVTGGRGVVGRPLVAELERRGHEVWVCDLGQYHHPRYLRCDVGNIRQLQRVFNEHEFDLVYHLAAEFGRHNGEHYYENLWMTNAVGTKNMIDLQEKRGFKLVFFSSSEVYGDYDDVMSEEVMDNVALRQLNDYAMTKWVGEMQVMNSQDLANTETVRVRLFNVYGPGEFYSPYRSAICIFIYHALFGLPYKVYQAHSRTSLYISDLVKTLGNIASNFKPGNVYNIGGTQYHDMKLVSDMILGYLNLDDSQVSYIDIEPQTTQQKRVDTTRAVNDLGHAPTVKIEDGIAQTIEWMRNTYSGREDDILP